MKPPWRAGAAKASGGVGLPEGHRPHGARLEVHARLPGRPGALHRSGLPLQQVRLLPPLRRLLCPRRTVPPITRRPDDLQVAQFPPSSAGLQLCPAIFMRGHVITPCPPGLHLRRSQSCCPHRQPHPSCHFCHPTGLLPRGGPCLYARKATRSPATTARSTAVPRLGADRICGELTLRFAHFRMPGWHHGRAQVPVRSAGAGAVLHHRPHPPERLPPAGVRVGHPQHRGHDLPPRHRRPLVHKQRVGSPRGCAPPSPPPLTPVYSLALEP